MLLLAVPFSLCWHLPQAEYKVWGFLSLYLCIWLLRALEKELPLENLSDKWEKNIPSKCLLTFFLTALLSPSDHVEFHELLFERLKTKVHTQPLVTGLRDDFLYLWATFHRGNSVSVNHSKSSLMVQLGTQAHWRILSDPFCLVFPGFTSVRFRAEQNSLRSSTDQETSNLFLLCVSDFVLTEQVSVPRPLVYLKLGWICLFSWEAGVLGCQLLAEF